MEKSPIKDDVILIAAVTGNQSHVLKKLGRNKWVAALSDSAVA